MSDCNDTLRELETFLDDELTPETRDAIHAHLDGCPDCLQAFDFHAELKAMIASSVSGRIAAGAARAHRTLLRHRAR